MSLGSIPKPAGPKQHLKTAHDRDFGAGPIPLSFLESCRLIATA